MSYRALSTFVLTIAVSIAAAPAHATPRPLSRGFGAEIAPAGEQILVTRTDGANLRVFAIPVTGGVAREVFAFDVPNGLYLESADLAASPQRAALTITMVKSFRDNIRAVQAFAGPVGGGWGELRPFTELSPDFPFSVQVDGERIFTLESRGGVDDEPHVVVRDPDPHEVAFASADEAESATFAGDFVAYRSGPTDGRDLGDVLVVRDWRTGAVLSSADLQDDVGSIALRPDGRVAASTIYDGSLYELRPGEPPRLLTRHGGSPAYAGDSLVFWTDEVGLRVVEPSGRIRRFGAPTVSLMGFATDGSRVFWWANGCLLVDDVSAPPAAAPGPGPCPRSELALANRSSPHLARTLPVKLRCVAAPRACRGAVRLTTVARPSTAAKAISRRLRFSIPAGQARRLHVPLTGRGYRILRRKIARANAPSEFERDVFVVVDARTDDGARLQSWDDELDLARPARTRSRIARPPSRTSR